MNKDKGIYLVIFLLTTVLLAVSKDTLSKRNQNTGIQSYDKFLSNYEYPFEVGINCYYQMYNFNIILPLKHNEVALNFI